MTTPPETITFCFTDIEGSTKLWEEHAGVMQAALAKHDVILRQAIEQNNGKVFKTIGDAFCATFEDASDALRAVVEAQQAILREPWPAETPIKVRMALHAGHAETRDNDFFGPTVNRVARLLSIAHGGQTVVSESLSQLIDPLRMPEASLRDLGVHRLKDLLQPERVYQVDFPSLPSRFPVLRSLDSTLLPNNLPIQLTTFVGRETELAKVSGLLLANRLVTVTGSGGCGKTRLALQSAAEIAERFPDGIWYVELASISDSSLVPQTVAGLVGVREEPGQSVLQALTSYMRPKKQLIILDNCEHVLLACAQFAEALLRTCPEVRILATSREALNIAGETPYRVPSLRMPDPRRHSDPVALEQFESVQLLLDRARAVSPGFTVSKENSSALARLCVHLDGIPLAIELAAARVRSLSIEQIEQRLDDRFRFLTGGSRTALPRQQTLRALVDWSYDLLGDNERALLRRLAVFAGGWSLSAAENVAADELVEEWEVLELLTSLIDKSLVFYESTDGIARYRLLETVKYYATDKLRESNEDGAVLERHLDWCARLAAEAGSWMRGPKQEEWHQRLNSEQDNLWRALETGTRIGDKERTGEIAWTLGMMLHYEGFYNDAVKAIEVGIKAFDGSEVDVRVLASLLYERAGLHQDLRESDAALGLATKALAQFEEAQDLAGTARAENLIGQVAMDRQDYEEAERRFEQSLTKFRQIGDQLGVSIVLNNKGVLSRRDQRGGPEERSARLEGAREFLRDSLEIRRSFNDLMGQAETLNNLGVIAFECEDLPAAWEHYRESLRIEHRLNRTVGIGTALANLGEVAGILNDTELGMRLLATSERVFEDIKSPFSGAVHSMLLDMGEGLEKEEIQKFVSEARTATLDTCIQQALVAEPIQGSVKV